jgi:hypothetical protein
MESKGHPPFTFAFHDKATIRPRAGPQDPGQGRGACRGRGAEATLRWRSNGDRARHLSPRRRELVG